MDVEKKKEVQILKDELPSKAKILSFEDLKREESYFWKEERKYKTEFSKTKELIKEIIDRIPTEDTIINNIIPDAESYIARYDHPDNIVTFFVNLGACFIAFLSILSFLIAGSFESSGILMLFPLLLTLISAIIQVAAYYRTGPKRDAFNFLKIILPYLKAIK
ncbi:MAG: hypothetical protein ACK5JF_02880 [Oscillospiraceae bacterium]